MRPPERDRGRGRAITIGLLVLLGQGLLPGLLLFLGQGLLPGRPGQLGPREAAAEESEWPAGTLEVLDGLPPLAPWADADEDLVLEWHRAALAHGRAHAGTEAGGDLLLSAAWGWWRLDADSDVRARLFEEAADAYAPRDAYAPCAWLEAARRRAALGQPDAARALLDRARRELSQPRPLDMEERPLARWARADEHYRRVAPRLEVDIDAAAGRYADAAERLERLADEGPPVAWGPGPSARARAWQEAARLRARAGETEAARADAERALEHATGGALRTEIRFWRLFLENDLLRSDASMSVVARWPGGEHGGALREALDAVLRAPETQRHAGRYLLVLGSSAFTAGADEAALEMYLRALENPALVADAYDQAHVAGGLLMALPVALRLERFDDADRVLDSIGTLANLPAAELDRYRMAIAEGREDAAARARRLAVEAAGPSNGSVTPGRAAGAPGGGLLGHAEAGHPEGGGPAEGETKAGRRMERRAGKDPAAGDTPAVSPLVGGTLAALLALVAILAWRAVRRR